MTTTPPSSSKPDPQTGWRFRVATTAPEAQMGTAPVLAITGLIIWAVTYYVFNNNIPSAVSVGLYTVIPAAIGWISTHVTFKKVTL